MGTGKSVTVALTWKTGEGAVVTGDVCYISNDTGAKATKASADSTGSGVESLCCVAGANTDTVVLWGPVKAKTVETEIAIGAALYLDDTAGEVTDIAPSATGDYIRPVGYALADAAAGLVLMMFAPYKDAVRNV